MIIAALLKTSIWIYNDIEMDGESEEYHISGSQKESFFFTLSAKQISKLTKVSFIRLFFAYTF